MLIFFYFYFIIQSQTSDDYGIMKEKSNFDGGFNMDAKTAWDKFILTGSIYDYLQYNYIKKKDNEKELLKFENNYKWSGNSRTDFK